VSATDADLAARKAELRARARASRAAVGASERAAASEAVAGRAAQLPEVTGARVVLGYRALAEEIDPAPLLDVLRAQGARIALPRVAAPGELALHWLGRDEDLVRGELGVLEPAPDAPGPRLEEVDLVVVPGVAFDARCRRLGMGGGFYDRLLASLPASSRAIALAYDAQMVEEVPADEHDRPVTLVVTPSFVCRP
jgi:5-formyltetrahydrofolate cyclo-ligase